MKKCLFLFSVSGLLFFSNPTDLYAEPEIQQDTVPQVQKVEESQLPQKHESKIDQRKLEIAKELTTWLNKTLQEKRALVAIVGRRGKSQTRRFDKTGMGHAGLAVYDPRAESWIIYNLLSDPETKSTTSSLWRSAPLDFFYGQKDYGRDALLLIPDEVLQKRLYQTILDGRYKKLFFTRTYNLLSAPDSDTSLNCNKWLLMNLAAARQDIYEPAPLLKHIGETYQPGLIRLRGLVKSVIQKQSNIRAAELPKAGPIPTVTVESLYRSDYFAEKIFYSGKSL